MDRKKHHSAGKLTDDLLINILSRLPPKPLRRFRCVSKAWHALMSDEYYRTQLPQAMAGIFYHFRAQESHLRWVIDREYISISDYDSHFIDAKLSFLSSFKNIRIVDCCGGLLLCRLWDSTSSILCVCNPVTQRWTLLPHRPHNSLYSLFLAFDPVLSPHFSVIRFNRNRMSQTIELELFSSETGDWAKHEVLTGTDTSFLRPRRRIFLHGCIYMVTSKNNLVALELKSMDCHRIEMPVSTPLIRNGLLGRSQGKLHYAVKENGEIKVWVLEDRDRHVWVLKQSIRLERVFEQQNNESQASSLQHANRFDVLAFHPDTDIVFLKIQDRLQFWYLNNGELREFCILRQKSMPWFFVFSPCLTDVLENQSHE